MRESETGIGILRVVLGVLALAVAAVAFGVYWIYQNPLAFFARLTRSELDKAGLERQVVGAAGRPMTVWKGGSGPSLVFLHGAGHQAGAWSKVAPAFLDGYTVHVPDLPGHGDSEPSDGVLPMAEIYGGLEAYLLSLDEPSILVGNSMGAWLAMIQAHRHPDLVRRAVLINGGGLFNPATEGLSLTPADREAARTLMKALRDPSSPAIPDYVLDDIAEQAGRGPIGRLMQDPDSLVEHLLDEQLGEIPAPFDLLWGASDHLMTVDYARRMVTELPRARLTLLERCGHIPASECPERLVEALRSVLDSEPPAARPEPEASTEEPAPPTGGSDDSR